MDRDTAEPSVRGLPGDAAEAWIEYHHEYAAPSEYSHEFVWDVTADAEGPFCTDVDGNVLLDFTCHIGAAPLGYNNPKILDRMEEFDLVDPMKIAGQDFYAGAGSSPTEPTHSMASQLMERLIDVTDHYGMDTVFLCNSGAEAIENAMKITYAQAGTPKYGVTFVGGFHGRTLGTLSMTRTKSVYTRSYPEVAGTRTVPFCEDRSCDAESCSCGFFAGERSQLERLLEPEGGYVDPDEVSFMVLEPVQGVGGYNFPSESFMTEVARINEEYDIPLIVDEIQSGVGRTGKMWASDHYPIEPDVIASAKALRSAATISRSDVFPQEKNRIGSTWGGGDILAAMQGVLTLDAIEEYDLLENAVERGEHMKERLRDAEPEGVVDVRGLGLMLAVEFDTADRRNAVVENAIERGMLTLGCGKKAIRLLPPLDVTAREIDLGADLLLESIDAAA
ncbi:aminotransferase class III-fold pyridoxal phosphate-dependent enzyme [Natronobeatus ordinarius]|uniref:aminotransferase class III-fold pyridoxal phosphate-dependent enzyme n=1 Tax=Natronobeatus ordinarius TaxID=2963433 RepID=UPI0020CF5618|nr:aminotransferase class III-fold pyridoxal phosphate-dependent enzyme [Natronobeatus ordinarius]